MPFGKDNCWVRPFANLKIGLQYIAYTVFNGAARNFDEFGCYASDNNTVFVCLDSVLTRPSDARPWARHEVCARSNADVRGVIGGFAARGRPSLRRG